MKVRLYDTDYQIHHIELSNYSLDDSLCIDLISIDDEGFLEPFARLTVCLGLGKDFANEHYSFLDTNNNSWAIDFVKEYNLATPTTLTRQSGYCIYPLYEWNVNELMKYVEVTE